MFLTGEAIAVNMPIIDHCFRCCSYHAASKYSFRVYVYIRQLDCLCKGPKFNYNCIKAAKLEDSIKGILVLWSILNYDIIKFHESSGYSQYWSKLKDRECGWAKALKESQASYKRKMLIEKPGQSLSKQSPSPTTTCWKVY